MHPRLSNLLEDIAAETGQTREQILDQALRKVRDDMATELVDPCRRCGGNGQYDGDICEKCLGGGTRIGVFKVSA